MAAAIILAAGASTRLGEAKQLVTLAGERLLERAVRVAGEAGLAPVLVVLGARAAEIEAACDLRGAQVVWNDAWREGMGASIRAGVAALGAETTGVVVMACDQPAVDAAHLCLLEGDGQTTVASAYDGRHGVPAYFPATALAALRALGGDRGARDLLQQARAVNLAGGGLDIDAAESLERARLLYEGKGAGQV